MFISTILSCQKYLTLLKLLIQFQKQTTIIQKISQILLMEKISQEKISQNHKRSNITLFQTYNRFNRSLLEDLNFKREI